MASTTFCPSCGAEYLAGVTECSDCHVALGVPLAVAPNLVAPVTAPQAAEEGDEVVYDLGDWSQDDRNQLELLLTSAGVVHRWEVGSDLVILDADEAAVEAMLDEVEASSAAPPLPASDDEFDEGDDEATYAVMSNLFVAADRLQKDPGDASAAGELFIAADAAAATPPPFGIDRPDWRQVQELAASLAAAIESEVDDDVVGRDASSLRAMLARYV